MASRRVVPSAIPKTSTPISVQLPAQTVKTPTPTPPVLPPPPSSPPSISLKDLQDAFAENVRKTEEMLNKVETRLEKKTEQVIKQQQELIKQQEEFCENITTVFQGLAEHIDGVVERVDEIEQKVDVNDYRLESVEEGLEAVKNDVLIGQFREMEYAIRVRGLAENPKENLREQIAAALAEEMGCGQEIIYDEIERAYRVNSWVARQRNLPRDVVVYFTRKTRRNEVMQRFYQQRFKILQQDVILLKEIPPKILRGRRDYAFLAQELKNRQLMFRWDVPAGIVLTYAGKRYRLNSVKKAKDFMASVLQADRPPTPNKDDVIDQLVVDLPGTSSSADGQHLQESVKDQRITRAAYRRREKEQQKASAAVPVSAPPTGTEPVGGARPKSYASSLVAGLKQKPKDG